MSKFRKKAISFILTCILLLVPVSSLTGVQVFAADFDDLNVSSVFLKQQTSVTCTLSSAAMMLRRTAICAEYSDWGNITEENIRSVGWIDGVGLRWSFTSYGMSVRHGYFSGSDNKLDMIDLLEKYPQGIVIYNGGSSGQHHAVFLCDYDESTDTFYVADPASYSLQGRIKLEESTIVGETQSEQINNLTAYWYVSDPTVELSDSNYVVSSGTDISNPNINNQYDPTDDCNVFESSKSKIYSYYVVTDSSSTGSALRNYPSGNSSVSDYAKKGTILYITYQGKNKFGALWYKTISGNYIFSSNVMSFEEYSEEIVKFNSTLASHTGTYSAASVDGSGKVALRIEPSEGNNIIACVNDGSLLYVTQSGVNSVGAKWYKTSDGYYVKASEMKFVSESKDTSSGFEGTSFLVTGTYSSEPVEDTAPPAELGPAYYEITASSLNVRKSAVDGEIIGSLPKGTCVQVVEVSDGWGKISYNGADGWISLQYAVAVDIKSVPLEITGIKLSENRIENGKNISCSVSLSDVSTFVYKYSLYNIGGELVSSISSKEAVFDCEVYGSGYYYFKVDVLDSVGRSASAYSGNFVVFDKLQLDTVTSNIDSFTYVYETVEWTANAPCISDTAVFNYSLYMDGELVSQRTSDSEVFSFVPENKGSYTLEVYISDEHSETQSVVSDPVTVYSALSIDAINLSATSAIVGSEITCSVAASGGTQSYTYCFSVFSDGKLIKNGAFSKVSETVQLFDSPGTYKFFCTVVDSGSMLVSSFSADVVVFDLLKGDVDSDGNVTARDARLVLRYSASLEKLSDNGVAAADVNDDGKVNAFDARCILRYAAKIENSFG